MKSYGKVYSLVIAILIAVIAVMSGARAAEQAGLPAGGGGAGAAVNGAGGTGGGGVWRLVSTPCDFTIDQLRAAEGFGDAEILEWDGEGYREPEVLRAGQGFVISRGAVWPAERICGNRAGGSVVTYRKGWNLVGEFGRFHANFIEAHEKKLNSSKLAALYSVADGKYIKKSLSGELDRFAGYWAYFDEASSIDERVRMELALTPKQSGWEPGTLVEMLPGGVMDFRITIYVYRYGAKDPFVSYNVHTDNSLVNKYKGEFGKIEIVSTKPDVVSVDEEQRAHGAGLGIADLHARIGEFRSNDVRAAVFDAECSEFNVYYEPKKLGGGADADLLKMFKNRDDPNRTFFSGWGIAWNPSTGGAMTMDWLIPTPPNQVSPQVKPGYVKLAKDEAWAAANKFFVGTGTGLHAVCRYSTSVPGVFRDEDVTGDVKWVLSDAASASIPAGSRLMAEKAGSFSMTVELDGETMAKYSMEVETRKLKKLYLHAFTVRYGPASERLYIGTVSYISSIRQATCKGGEADHNCYFMQEGELGPLALFGAYNDGTVERIKSGAVWNVAEPQLVSVDDTFTLIAKGAGAAEVTAEYSGVTSDPISVTVFADKRIDMCDPANPNTSAWSDYNGIEGAGTAKTRATITTDCAAYREGETVNMYFTAQLFNEIMTSMASICLDLRVKDSSGKTVKTLKYEGCDRLPAWKQAAIYDPEFNVVYEHLGRWDMTDSSGQRVKPGRYTAFAQFNILFEPVVTVDFEILPDVECEDGAGPACGADADCDDGNELTIDTCADAGTCDAACVNTACEIQCSAYAECNDGNELTADACVNPGTCAAACVNTACDVSCGGDSDCDDGNELTTDTCADAGTCGAACVNTAPLEAACVLTLDKVNYAPGDTMGITFSAGNPGDAAIECGARVFLKRDKDTTVWMSFDDDIFVTIPAGGIFVQTLYYTVPEEWVDTNSSSGSNYGIEPVDRAGAVLGKGDNFNVKSGE